MGVLLRFIKKFLRGFGALLGGLMELVCILAVVLGIAVGPLFANAITMYTGAKDYKVEGGTDATYFASDYADADEQYDAAAQLAREVEAGGIVLVRNDDVADDPALPLARGSRVTLLGQDAVDFVYGGSGSGSVDSSKADTLKQALEQAGLEVNPTAWDFYEEGPGKDYRKKTPDVTGKGDYAVNECPVSEFTDELCDSYANYSDAAVVVETYVQDHESWWDGKVSVHAQSPDGAYYIYEMACSEEDAAKLVPGTKIRVSGFKGEWSGEVEIMDPTFEFVEGDSWLAEPVDLSALMGSEDLAQYMNQRFSVKDGVIADKGDGKAQGLLLQLGQLRRRRQRPVL